MWRRFAQRKALAKTVSWRGLSFVVTTFGVWVITGRPTLAASVGLAEVIVKSFGYYLHECVWEWGDLHKGFGGPFFAWVRKRVGWLAEDPNVVRPEESIG
jgi:uncharacterized membrane protein